MDQHLTSRISNLYKRSRQRNFKGYIQYEMANTDCRIDNNSVSFSSQSVIINIADFIPEHLFFRPFIFSGRPYLDPGSCKVNRLG